MADDPDPPVIPDPPPPPDPNSILVNIKKLLGIEADEKAFDVDVITDINSMFMTLNQLGVGPADVFSIEDDTAVWTDFVANIAKVAAVKSYIHLKVKMIFDPPTASTVLDAMTRVISEMEWRLMIQVEEPLPDIPILVEGDENGW